MISNPAHKVSVLHTAETLRGGIASYLDEILPAQVERYGYGNVSILVGASQVRELKNLRGIVIHTHPDSSNRVANTFALARKLRKLVKESTFDLVHAHSTLAGFAARSVLGLLKNRPKLVYCAHGWAFDREAPAWQGFLARKLELAFSHLADAIICISKHDLQSGINIGIRPERMMLVPNGIAKQFDEEADVATWPPDNIRVLFAGRFDKQKGVDVFAAALTALGPRWHGFAIGTPVVDQNLPVHFPDNVTLCGWLPRADVQQYLRSCDVVVIPSRWEGFGLVAVEAMRASKAVIATAVGGLAEIVVDGSTGHLIRPGSTQELTDTLRSLTGEELARMGASGHQRFLDHYTADRLNEDIFRLYESLTVRAN